MRILSTKSTILCGGLAVIYDTVIATIKFKNMPITPIPSGEIQNHQFSEELADGLMNLN